MGPGNAIWATSVEDAIQRATREGKFVFFEFTKKECGNCQRMDGLLYPAFDFEALLVPMVPVKVSFESPWGKDFASRYSVEDAPAVLITTPEGRLVFLAETVGANNHKSRHLNSPSKRVFTLRRHRPAARRRNPAPGTCWRTSGNGTGT